MRLLSGAVLLAALLQAATGWSDTEDWSYEEWSEGWQHNAGSAQDVFYAEGPGDTDAFTAGYTATELSTLTGGIKTIGAYSVSGGSSLTRVEEVARGVGTTVGQVVTEIPLPTDGPTFAKQPTQIVSAVGHNVTFQCRVQNIGEKEVIWLRSRDLQILSVGPAVFSSDARVSAAQRDTTRRDATQRGTTRNDATQSETIRRDRTHNLTIALLRPSDAGTYECQLNTDPKRSLYFNLTVLPVMPQIEIWVTGGGAVREGDAAVLRCAARLRAPYTSPGGRDAPTDGRDAPPGGRDAGMTHAVKLALRWYKDGEPVELQSTTAEVSPRSWRRTLQEGGGVSVWAHGGGAWRRSVLRVRRVTSRRAGRYECRAAPHTAAHAHLTVLATGTTEMWAEGMQRDEAGVAAAAVRAAPGAPLSRGAALLVLATVLTALAARALLDCTAHLAVPAAPFTTR